ncbi:conserved exported hypothetical protein [Flavobacterium sp. 9AF]|uniref:hypothetical protein n=1 Tax=Flavobacterium sp. 9AF TaxID=2653142 RepID=UPI0012F244AF|nr:hypothetical protein [Flavobacterium sp. 9AF]VXA95157.1 conserved exported hypothetical protein [Flavobacterium sp. 9AF]
MKKQLLSLLGFVLAIFVQAQETEVSIKLKQITSVETNTKTGEYITKKYSFQNGKLTSIKTSDIIQSFFYNKEGYLDKTVRENEMSDWKEIATYFYDDKNNLVKYVNEYEDGGKSVTKTISYKYEGNKINAITKKSNSSLKFVQWIDYTLENGRIINESERDINGKVITNKKIDYIEGDLIAYKGVFGDRSTDSYDYDDKQSAMRLLVQNVFGKNYKTIVTLIAPHEKEFSLESISYHNFLKFSSTTPSKKQYEYSYTYNDLNYPKTHIEHTGLLKTIVNYEYE